MNADYETLQANADSLGLILGHAVARRFLQLRSASPGARAGDDVVLSELVLKSVRDMYVVMATSEDPFPAMDRTLELEAQFSSAAVDPGTPG